MTQQLEDMVSVKKEDANNYCRILSELGMEEEGDPVAEVVRLQSQANAWFACCDALAAVKPDFMTRDGTGTECAVEAIRELARDLDITERYARRPIYALRDKKKLYKTERTDGRAAIWKDVK